MASAPSGRANRILLFCSVVWRTLVEGDANVPPETSEATAQAMVTSLLCPPQRSAPISFRTSVFGKCFENVHGSENGVRFAALIIHGAMNKYYRASVP